MTEQLSRAQLVDELIVANEEAEYHAERAMLLETELRQTVNLLRNWWGMYTLPGTAENHAILKAINKATQDKLVHIEKADLL